MKSLSSRARLRIVGAALALSSVGVSSAFVAAPAAHATTTAVTTTNVNMRSGAGTSYAILTVVPVGATVTVTGSASGSWTPVSYGGRTGYIYTTYLKLSSSTTTSTAGTRTTTADLNVRTGPGTTYSIVGVAPAGTAVTPTGVTSGSWVQITWQGASRWVSGNYLTGTSVTVEATPLASTVSAKQQAVVDYAMAQLGDAYVWGGNGPDGFDCSGLTYMAYKQIGITLPRVSADQAKVGTAVSRSAMQPGDLIFFNSPVNHVAMYIGNGKMVHARNYTTGVTTNYVDDYAQWAPINVIRRYV